MRFGSSCPGPSDSAVRAPIESVQYGVHYQQFSSQASTPSRTRSSRRRPSGRRHLLLARACPRTDIAQQRRFRSGSAEHQEQRSAPTARAAGRALARAHTHTAPAVLINAHPANSSTFGPDSHRVAKPSPKKPVCLVLFPCARATDWNQTQMDFFVLHTWLSRLPPLVSVSLLA